MIITFFDKKIEETDKISVSSTLHHTDHLLALYSNYIRLLYICRQSFVGRNAQLTLNQRQHIHTYIIIDKHQRTN